MDFLVTRGSTDTENMEQITAYVLPACSSVSLHTILIFFFDAVPDSGKSIGHNLVWSSSHVL